MTVSPSDFASNMGFGLPTYSYTIARESLLYIVSDIALEHEVVETMFDHESGKLAICKGNKWYTWDGEVWDQIEPFIPSLRRMLEGLL